MFTELFTESFAWDGELIKQLRKGVIDKTINSMHLKKSPKFSLNKYGIDINFFDKKAAEEFEDPFYEYLEDNDIDVSWTRKGPVISIKTYKD